MTPLAKLPALSLVGLVGCLPSWLDPVDDLAPFVDRSGHPCSAVAEVAYGRPFAGIQANAVAGAGDLLYVFSIEDDTTRLTILDVATPAAPRQLGHLPLPRVGWIDVAEVHDGLLLASWSRPREQMVAIDVSDPTAPAVLDELELGSTGAPSAFSVHGDRAFTDGGDYHAIDLSDPAALVGLTWAGQRPFGSPLVVGDQLLSGDWDGALGEHCWVGVYDISSEGPTLDVAPSDAPVAVQQVAVDTCLRSGLAATEGGVVGIGYRDDGPHAESLSSEGGGWSSAGDVALGPLGFEGVDDVAGFGSAAVVLGEAGVVVLDPRGGALVHAGSWVPSPAFVESLAVAAGLAWVVVSRESGDFEGVVGLDPRGCL
jgi:hypothetical protein